MTDITDARHRLMVRQVHENLDELRAASLVLAIEDGKEIVVKGEEVLEQIIRSGVTRQMVVHKVPSPSADFTEALRQVLNEGGTRQ